MIGIQLLIISAAFFWLAVRMFKRNLKKEREKKSLQTITALESDPRNESCATQIVSILNEVGPTSISVGLDKLSVVITNYNFLLLSGYFNRLPSDPKENTKVQSNQFTIYQFKDEHDFVFIFNQKLLTLLDDGFNYGHHGPTEEFTPEIQSQLERLIKKIQDSMIKHRAFKESQYMKKNPSDIIALLKKDLSRTNLDKVLVG